MKEKSPERKFMESVDLFINFKNIDFTKPENKIKLDFMLPNGRGKKRNICIICGEEMAPKAKKVASKVIMETQLTKMGKTDAKKLAQEYDFFIAQANLMPEIGKRFGQVLAPRGKMPKPLPPGADPAPLVKNLESSILVKNKGKNMQVMHIPVGTREMKDEELAQNIDALLNAIIPNLPSQRQSVKSVFIKTTMGPTVKIEV